MSPAQFERLQQHLQRLRLFKSCERLEALLQQAAADEMSYADFLDQVLSEEVASKTAKNITMRTNLEDGNDCFHEFTHQPNSDQLQVLSGSGMVPGSDFNADAERTSVGNGIGTRAKSRV
jgi:DNA replication protein DnaC